LIARQGLSAASGGLLRPGKTVPKFSGVVQQIFVFINKSIPLSAATSRKMQ
jgi:hypothetical protein